LYDALKATNGEVLVATNQQGRKAAQLFLETEGVDIHPAAGIATASLIKAVEAGKIDREKIVMLNITGAGEARFKSEHEVYSLEPSKVFPLDVEADEVISFVEGLFSEDNQ
jgi:cysteate synthase